MNSKPRIIVLRMREIIYTVLLVLLVILLFLCLFLMFSPGNSGGGNQMAGTEQQTTGAGETTADTNVPGGLLTQTTEQTQADTAAQSGTDHPSGQSDAAAQSGTDHPSGQSDAAAQPAAAQSVSADRSSAAVSSSMSFTPGVYTVPVFLNDAAVDVEVTVDSDHINAIRLVNLNETVETMYPLMSPALENITSQILQRQTLDGITCPRENLYTSQVLLNAVSDALDIAGAD